MAYRNEIMEEFAETVAEMNREEVLETLAEIDESILDIKNQIDRARQDMHEGVTVDQDWFRRLNVAKRYAANRRSICCTRLSTLNKEEKAANIAKSKELSNSNAEAFIAAAKTVLDKDTYLKIWALARESRLVSDF